eukprot:scaffold2357_cov167-Amphora_coffeaeformis.AAC.39
MSREIGDSDGVAEVGGLVVGKSEGLAVVVVSEILIELEEWVPLVGANVLLLTVGALGLSVAVDVFSPLPVMLEGVGLAVVAFQVASVVLPIVLLYMVGYSVGTSVSFSSSIICALGRRVGNAIGNAVGASVVLLLMVGCNVGTIVSF